jgi:hypothetical protein
MKLVKNVMIKAVLGATTTFVLLTTSSSAAEFHFGAVLSTFQSCLAESVFDKPGATIREKDFNACMHSLGADGAGDFGSGFQVNSAGLRDCIKQRQPTILRDGQVILPVWDYCVSNFVKVQSIRKTKSCHGRVHLGHTPYVFVGDCTVADSKVSEQVLRACPVGSVCDFQGIIGDHDYVVEIDGSIRKLK